MLGMVVLGFASQANAQNWVLWDDWVTIFPDNPPNPHTIHESWEIVSAFPSLKNV